MGNAHANEAAEKFKASSLPCTKYEAGYSGLVFCNGECEQIGSVWGTGPYTSDSCVCRAARHAGVIGPSGVGVFKVNLTQGKDQYEAGLANGIQTAEYFQSPNSISVEKVA